jgi:hypothetical protein
MVTATGHLMISRAQCLRLADEAYSWTMAANDPAERRDLVLVELAWRCLARSHADFEACKFGFCTSRPGGPKSLIAMA